MNRDERALQHANGKFGATFRNAGYIKGDKDCVAISAKWIQENVGDSVAVDYLNFMEEKQ